jgi:hypothetical protein
MCDGEWMRLDLRDDGRHGHACDLHSASDSTESLNGHTDRDFPRRLNKVRVSHDHDLCKRDRVRRSLANLSNGLDGRDYEFHRYRHERQLWKRCGVDVERGRMRGERVWDAFVSDERVGSCDHIHCALDRSDPLNRHAHCCLDRGQHEASVRDDHHLNNTRDGFRRRRQLFACNDLDGRNFVMFCDGVRDEFAVTSGHLGRERGNGLGVGTPDARDHHDPNTGDCDRDKCRGRHEIRHVHRDRESSSRLNTPILIGSGVLGGLSINGSDARIAVNDIEVYLATNGTSVPLPGHAVSMQGADTLSFDDADNATYLDGAIQNGILTDLPPTLYQGTPAWFDTGGNVQTPSGMIFSTDGTQDGINLQANGSLLTWIEEILPGGTTCQVWASVAGGQPQQVTNVTYCAAGQEPLDVGNGHLFILWSGVNVAESRDNGATWTIGTPTNTQAQQGVAVGIPNVDAPSSGSTNIAYSNGTTYIAWQQRGDPQTVDDVYQGWLSKSTIPGQWSDAELLYPGTSARVGDFTPVVAADGSDALFSLEQGNGGIILNSTLLVSDATGGPLIGLLPNGTRIVAWQDVSGVWFEEVPK